MQNTSLPFHPQPRMARTSAFIGLGVWLVLLAVSLPVAAGGSVFIERLVMLAPLVIVPLGLSLVRPRDLHGLHTWPYRLALITQPIGALAATVALLFPAGRRAGGFALVWFGVTCVIALNGISRFVLRGSIRSEELAISFGLMFVSVGGAWFWMSRQGFHPLGFDEPIVLLTGMHFHYTGFAAPILTGLTGRAMRESGVSAGLLYRLTVGALLIGTPIVAAGITIPIPLLALAGAFMISASLCLLAGLVIGRIVPMVPTRLAGVFLLISSGSAVVGMILAFLYAYSQVAQKVILTIPQMAYTHGILNAIGFALCGLMGWALVRSRED
ncbi:MAG: YndJ family protein [Pyrinomonadaceae bacterium]